MSEPILGPNFTHLSVEKDVTLFLGTVDVASSKQQYLKGLDELHSHCRDQNYKTFYPLLIATLVFA